MIMSTVFSSSIVLILLISQLHRPAATAATNGGNWSLLQPTIGVSAMHMQLLHNDRVIIFDRTDFGPSNLTLPSGNCRTDPNDLILKLDCSAHSVEYNVAANSYRPLTLLTDTWCSSATVSPDGRLFQTGGFNDGERAVRIFPFCENTNCDWIETPIGLAVRRWYSTNQILPDGRSIIIGGRRQFNYEFYPKDSTPGVLTLPFLSQTKDPEENNLYPFVHLNIDGNLFIFANNRAILLNYNSGKIVKTYPTMPGGDPRNYPSSGSSVMLPLTMTAIDAEILVCGGAPKGAYNQSSRNGTFMKGLSTCGRIKITSASPIWEMETMPLARVMGDRVLLPNGEDVLIINGAGAGTAGWELGREPVLCPVIYRPDEPSGSRFFVQSPSSIPRMYHSTAVLLRDGRVLVGGSNPHIYYNFSGVRYPTELSLEAFSPDYLGQDGSIFRPEILTRSSELELGYGNEFILRFNVNTLRNRDVMVTMLAPAFATHSFSMNQRLLVLGSEGATSISGSSYRVTVAAPPSGNLAPPGYYMVFVVNEGIPSEGVWVHIQ